MIGNMGPRLVLKDCPLQKGADRFFIDSSKKRNAFGADKISLVWNNYCSFLSD